MSYPLATMMTARRASMSLAEVFGLNILSNFYRSKIRNRQFIFKYTIKNFMEGFLMQGFADIFHVAGFGNQLMINHL